MTDLKLVKNDNPEIEGKKIYYCVAGKLELAIPSVNITKEEDGIIHAAEVFVISVRPSQFIQGQTDIGVSLMKDVKIQYNLLMTMHETDPIYGLVCQTMSGIVRPH